MSSWCAGADGTDGDGDGGDAKCDGTSGLVPVKHTLIHLSIHPSNTPSVYRFERLIWESGKTVTECQRQSDRQAMNEGDEGVLLCPALLYSDDLFLLLVMQIFHTVVIECTVNCLNRG